jgi:hypothetical protein
MLQFLINQLRWLVFLTVLAGSCFSCPLLLAQSAPTLLNFQGRLTNLAGAPVTTATSVTFKLLRGGTATEAVSTGTIVYQESASVTPDANGVFTFVIGTGTPAPAQTLTESDFDTSGIALYVEMSVAGDPLLPRTRVLSVPYAIESSRLGGMTAQAIIGQAGGSPWANAVVRNGAGLEWLSNSQIKVNPGTLGFPDGVVRRTTTTLTWDFANPVGPLGLDQGTEDVNTWYYLYAIPDPVDNTRFTAVASTRPPLQVGGLGPVGYGIHRFIGSFRNDGSSNVRRFFRTGNHVKWGSRLFERWLYTTGGGLPALNTWVSVNASAQMPETSRVIWIEGYYDSCSSLAGVFIVGPGPSPPTGEYRFCTDFGAGATTCEALVPTINRTFSWDFNVFSGGGDNTCQHTDHDFIGYLEDLSEL